ncbi:MAG: alpha/beta fold hydrolase [Planctomycetia bacterium]
MVTDIWSTDPDLALTTPADRLKQYGVSPVLYPFRSRFFDQRGVRQHTIDDGEGDPVVMVHGNPTWSFYFRSLAADLRHDHRVIVPDHVGCGLSDRPTDAEYPYRLERRIDDLERLLDDAGVHENVTLIVHDWGGMIGMGWAVRHPEAVKRIVVLNTAAFLLPPGKRLPRVLSICRDSAIGAWLVRKMAAFNLAAAWWCTAARPLDPDVRAALLAPYAKASDRLAVLRFVQDIPLAPADPSYAAALAVQDQIAVFENTPMLIGWGLRDFVFDADFLAEWRRRFPNAEVHAYDDLGHYILEDAADVIPALVRDFVDRT